MGLATAALRVVLAALAVGGATATFLAGIVALGVRAQPDTGHGEDIGRPLGLVAALVVVILAASVGIGASVGYAVLGNRLRRAVATVSLVLVAVGVLAVAYSITHLG